MRSRIYEIIEVNDDSDSVSKAYDIFMIITIIVSLIPLCFKTQTSLLRMMDRVSVSIFIIDYILRLITADFNLKQGAGSFIRYPFTPFAIIDLLCILPSLTSINNGFKVLKIFRLMRTFRGFRAFKAFRYSKNIELILRVFRKQKDSLIVVCWLAIAYIFISALIIFNAEPQSFEDFFEAIYWATISLTTVGYGDIYATSLIGKAITMISAFFGVAIVALPAGIITAGYMEEIDSRK